MKKPVLFLFLLFIGAQFAFQEKQNKTRGQLIQEALQSKIDEYRAGRHKECIKSAQETANYLVDSLLRARAKNRLDTLSKPAKPFKPLPPDLMIPLDEDTIAPFLNDLDTLF